MQKNIIRIHMIRTIQTASLICKVGIFSERFHVTPSDMIWL